MSAPAAGGTVGRRLAILASVVVLATIVASVFVNDTPAAQREIKLDARRVSDLRALEREIQRHVNETGALPDNLAALAAKPGVRLAVADPVTKDPYEFESAASLAYRLCASFTTDTGLTRSALRYESDAEWAHGKGRRCFERAADAKGR